MVESNTHQKVDSGAEIESLIEQLGNRVREDFAEDPLTVLDIPVPEGLSLEKQHQIAADVLINENFHSMAGKFWGGGNDVSADILEYNERQKSHKKSQ